MEGVNWSYDRFARELIVSDGCRAWFNVNLITEGTFADVYCEEDNGVNHCYVGDVFDNSPIPNFNPLTIWVKDRKSSSSCNSNEDFYEIGGYLTVNNGCRAIFTITK